MDAEREKADRVLDALRFMTAVGLEAAKAEKRNVTYVVAAASFEWAMRRIDALERELKENHP